MTASQAIFLTIIALLVLVPIAFRLFGSKPAKELEYDDASRLARLLIAEIKLFEGYKVARGLRNNNLASSLEIELEEARKKFQQRISNPEYAVIFDNAVVEILADGDRSKLGTT